MESYDAWSVPGGWVVHSFLHFATRSFVFDSFRVDREWAALLLEFDFRAEYRSHWLWLVEEVHCVETIGSRWSLIVLHDAFWSEEIVSKVGAEWNQATKRHEELSTGIHSFSHQDPLVSLDDCPLKILHTLTRGQLTACCWIKSVHIYTLVIIN